MATKRANPRKTAGRLIIDTLKSNKAFNESTAQPVTVFKDLPLSTTLIAYTIANLMQDNIIIQTHDEKYYFSQENWRKFESKFNRIYWILIIIPAVVMVALLLIQAFSNLF